VRNAAKSHKAQCYAKRQRRGPTAKAAKAAKAAAERVRAAVMAQWDEHGRRVEAARRRFPIYIALWMPDLLAAEREARAVPTSAAERAVKRARRSGATEETPCGSLARKQEKPVARARVSRTGK
jgi:hypothetical protein